MSDGALEMGQGFDVEAHPVRARVGEGVDVAVGVLDHQVDVQRQPGGAADRLDHRRADRDVGDEVPIHHVEVEERRPAALGPRDLLGEAAEVRGEDRRSEDHGPSLLISRLSAVRGLTRCPAAGSCRSTTPAGTPG